MVANSGPTTPTPAELDLGAGCKTELDAASSASKLAGPPSPPLVCLEPSEAGSCSKPWDMASLTATPFRELRAMAVEQGIQPSRRKAEVIQQLMQSFTTSTTEGEA